MTIGQDRQNESAHFLTFFEIFCDFWMVFCDILQFFDIFFKFCAFFDIFFATNPPSSLRNYGGQGHQNTKKI